MEEKMEITKLYSGNMGDVEKRKWKRLYYVILYCRRSILLICTLRAWIAGLRGNGHLL